MQNGVDGVNRQIAGGMQPQKTAELGRDGRRAKAVYIFGAMGACKGALSV